MGDLGSENRDLLGAMPGQPSVETLTLMSLRLLATYAGPSP